MTMPLVEAKTLYEVLEGWSKELAEVVKIREYLSAAEVSSKLADIRMDTRTDASVPPRCLQLLSQSVLNRLEGDGTEFRVDSLIRTLREALEKLS